MPAFHFLRQLFLYGVLLLAAGCGGGGSAPGTVSNTPANGSGGNPVISIVLQDGRGQTANALGVDAPLDAIATLRDGNGAALPNSLVEFSISGLLATLSPQSGVVATDANGQARIKLNIKDAQTAQTQAGAADNIKASASVNGKSVSASAVYQISAAPPSAGGYSISLWLRDSLGQTSRVASPDSPLSAQALVLDDKQQPAPNVLVSFASNATLSAITPASAIAATDSNGIAKVTLAPKDAATAQAQSGAADTIRASASVNGKNLSAQAIYQIGTSGGNAASASLSLQLQDSNGQSANSLTPGKPLTARATLLDAKGTPIPNALVSFATAGALAQLTPASGATLTNAQGVASINLSPKDLATALSQAGSADSLKAVATVGSNPLLASANFQLGASGVTLSLVAPASGAQALNAYDTAQIKVDVLVNGSPYTADPVTVNFSSACALSGRANLPASASTANGRAQVVYADAGCAASDTVTASFPGAPSVSATLNVASPQAASLSFVAASPSDQAIVIKGAGGIGRSETATLTFIALDTAGKPLPNQLINFSVNAGQPVTLQTASASTDANGKVSASVSSGTQATTFRVIAAFAGNPSISTISGNITVSNGVPTQSAFSLSTASSNIEGWSIDNTQTSITALLADASGNPVVDGTPIVFQTDSGAVGSSSNGGCNTSNGACSVTLRSQNPRYGSGNTAGKRPGLATISASSTTASVNISAQTGVFFSGSSARYLYPYGGNSAYSAVGNTLSTSACGVYALVVEVNDENYNPMPAGSKLSLVNVSPELSPGVIVPAVVPEVFPHDANGNKTLTVANLATRQGSVHTIPITLPSSCTAGGGALRSASFSLQIVSPSGLATVYPFTLTYPGS
ncbi:Ig-like domain-containing protein [Massilia sp. W12]|uniref:Ig-like domain-containing protein n=1 Tax=Massilia sp. W12 TaxID=3126507 RepID=UPI0030CBE8FE